MRRTHPTVGRRHRAAASSVLALVAALVLATGCVRQSASDDGSEPPASATQAVLATATLTVEGHKTAVTLYDTPASRGLLDELPLTLPVKDVWNQVKWLGLPDELATEGSETTTHAGNGSITYTPGNSMLMFAYIPTDFTSETYRIGEYDIADEEFVKSIETGTEATLSRG